MTALDLDAVTRIDDGTARPGDREIAAVFDRHSSDQWAAMDVQLDRWAADRCVICGKTGEGPECAGCAADWDRAIARSADV